MSERSESSDTEQEISDIDDDDDDVPLSERNRSSGSANSSNRACSLSHYLGKDGTILNKTPFRHNVRTRAENIIHQLPGVVPEAKSAMTELECWNLFFTYDMLQKILIYTNARIRPKIALCTNLSKYTHTYKRMQYDSIESIYRPSVSGWSPSFGQTKFKRSVGY